MSRQTTVLAALGAVIVAVAFFLLVWQPRNARLTEIEDEIATIEAEQAQLRTRVVELEEVRARAPQIESDILASQSIVPRDVALPSALRQLQLAADESGVTLTSVAPSRPAQLEGAEPGLSAIELSLLVDGGYFQIVDFLRRVEDPQITPRGVVWESFTLAPTEYPSLTGNLSGRMFASLPAPPQEEPTDGADGTDGEQEPGGDTASPAETPTETES